ncbi:MAG TPA: SGNH/GDSL hydrolase family protein [Verrucomicrobiae bacterium]|jgi:lysophospholipase L1-like esterase
MKFGLTIPFLFLLILTGWQAIGQTNGPSGISALPHQIRYAVIGDSYSNGEGNSPDAAWPAQLTRHLAASGMNVALVANPSRTGWTTQQAIDDELPLWRAARPDFASLQIGVNDWVQGVDAKTFQQRLVVLLDAMQQVLPDTNRLFLVTIPDFSVTPTGAIFSHGRDITSGLAQFNDIIKQEAARRGLAVVDIFALSQKMGGDPTLITPDGLHPSAKECRLWQEVIFPVAQKLLAKSARLK